MPVTRPKQYNCIVCHKRTKPDRRKFISGPTYADYREFLHLENESELDVSCINCYTKFYRCKTKKTRKVVVEKYTDINVVDDDNHEDDDYEPPPKKQCNTSPKIIPLPITSSGRSHSSCFICKTRKSKFQTLSTEIRHEVFISTGHLLLSGARCCHLHLNENGNLNEAALTVLKTSKLTSTTYFNKTDITDLITDIRTIALKNGKKRIDFDNNNALTESDFQNLTGITKINFDDLLLHIKSIRHSKNRSIKTCIALFLVRLRTGMSYGMLSTLFNIGKYSIRRAIGTARRELSQNFTTKYMGFQHITRQDIIDKHTRPLAKELFGNIIDNPVILVADGTYIYIEKSSNFKFQRRCYSMHKNRPLVKPMVFVSTSGYILSILGPYLADPKNNDANILKHNLRTNMEQMNEWLCEKDVLIVDRGFRDATDYLESLGITWKMPTFLEKGKKQHSVEEANSSRLVTKIRWVVESVNGRLKRWKYLANIVPNTQIPFLADDLKLVGALCNKYKPPLNTGNQEDDQILAAKMKVLATKGNALYDRVTEERLDRRISSWKRMDAADALEDFPILTEEELSNITLGVYQLKMAKSYSKEHFAEDGSYDILYNNEIVDVLRVKIQSRHTSAKSYMLWIEYDPVLVKGWYCQCKAGSRVVGACAHVSSVLWFLGFARHNSSMDDVKNWSDYLEDASHIPIEIDDSISDKSDVGEE